MLRGPESKTASSPCTHYRALFSNALLDFRSNTIYAMLSRQTPYKDRTVDYEAQMVKRNAPRWIRMLMKHGFIPQIATTA